MSHAQEYSNLHRERATAADGICPPGLRALAEASLTKFAQQLGDPIWDRATVAKSGSNIRVKKCSLPQSEFLEFPAEFKFRDSKPEFTFRVDLTLKGVRTDDICNILLLENRLQWDPIFATPSYCWM